MGDLGGAPAAKAEVRLALGFGSAAALPFSCIVLDEMRAWTRDDAIVLSCLYSYACFIY